MPLHVIAFGSVTESAPRSFESKSLGSGIWSYFTAPTCTVMRFIDGTSWIPSCAAILISFHLSLSRFSNVWYHSNECTISFKRFTPHPFGPQFYSNQFHCPERPFHICKILLPSLGYSMLTWQPEIDLITSQPSRLGRSIVEGKSYYRYPQAIEHFYWIGILNI